MYYCAFLIEQGFEGFISIPSCAMTNEAWIGFRFAVFVGLSLCLHLSERQRLRNSLEQFGSMFSILLAANPCVARDNYFYGDFINFFFII